MKLFSPRLILLSAALACVSAPSAASSLFENVIDLQTEARIYKPSSVLESAGMRYPSSASRNIVEGYIDVVFDVNTQGKAVNFRFNRSSGTDIFETIIERNFENWEFEPAIADGAPVLQTNLERSFIFSITKKANKFPEPLMRKNFGLAYVKMRDLLKAGEYEEFAKFATTMKKSNIIRFAENRQLSILIFSYLAKTGGSIQEQIVWLERALKGSPRSENIIKRHNKIKSNLFKKYVENKQYRKALSIFNELSNSEFSENLLPPLMPLIAEINAALNSDTAITMTAQVDGTALFSHALSRRVFTLQADSDIAFTELRCGEFNVAFDYVDNALYQMPFDWTSCSLSMHAPEGTLVTISEAPIYGALN
jgi:TonB family protein